MYIDNKQVKNYISLWLSLMFWMIALMIIVGGLTRLTDSGLSITEWELFEGFLPPLNDHLDEIGKAFSLSEVVLRQIWYQQYKIGDLHGWHNHAGCQFTGVYYLDQPKDAPKTQIITPLSDEVITIDFKEGDILIIPSYIIHTSQKNTSDKIKTIISFNFDWKNIFSDSLLKFNQHLN